LSVRASGRVNAGWFGDDRGWALISVLWVVSMLAMMAAATQVLTVTSYRSERSAIDRAQIEAALDAAVARAILGIADARIEQRWRVDGVPQTFSFNGHAIRVTVQDELGCFDLNAIDAPTLRQLLSQSGADESASEVLGDRILDWRTKSDGELSRLHGATDAQYASAGLPWHPRHGPFQSVAELQMVLGMTPAIYARIRPALTVYTNNAEIDPQIAPREALLALFDGDAGKVDAAMRQRNAPSTAQDEGGPSSRPGLLNPAMPLGGRAFEVKAQWGSRPHYGRDAVIELTGDVNRPYLVLFWQ